MKPSELHKIAVQANKLNDMVEEIVADTLAGLGPRCSCTGRVQTTFDPLKMVLRCNRCGHYTKTLEEEAMEIPSAT